MTPALWSTLGIEPTNDVAEIKRAYARRLKQVHPEDDPEGFQALRAAYDQATHLARNGWAVPRPMVEDEDQAEDEEEAYEDGGDGWSTADGPPRWTRPDASASSEGWAKQTDKDRWGPAEVIELAPAPRTDIPEDIRAELVRERELAEAHRVLCDALSTLLANPNGDKHEALSAMLRILRSPGMDSLDAYARTERWLAHVVAVSGPVADDLVEPLIHFFGWNERPVGVDMRHAIPVLERRDAGIALRRLERKANADHQAWLALRDPPTPARRLRIRLVPGLRQRVLALLEKIERELPQVAPHMHPEAAAWWRERRLRPDLSAEFLWILLLGPLFVAAIGSASIAFGPPSWTVALALWTVSTTAVLGAGLAWLHGVVRLRLRWLHDGLAWRAPTWAHLGWAPAALLTVILASFSGSFWMSVLAIVLGGAALAWRHAVRPDEDPRYVSSFIQTNIYHRLPLVMVGGFALAALGPSAVPLAWAAGIATLVMFLGQPALQEAWLQISPTGRRLAAAGLGVVSLAGALVIGLVEHPAVMSVTLAFAAVCGLLALPLNALQQVLVRRAVPVVQLIGMLFVVGSVEGDQSMAGHLPTIVGFGRWMFGIAALTAALSLLPEIHLPRRKRRSGADKFG